MKKLLIAKLSLMRRDNDLDAWNPEVWANESLMILEGNLILANRVHRGFENQIASYGDTVNTRKPGKFTAVRKKATDDVTIQDATATNVPVVLDQLLHVSFMIRDAERSKAFKDLVTEYLSPALLAEAEGVDLSLMGRIPSFMGNNAGKLQSLSSTTAKDDIIATRLVQRQKKVPQPLDMFLSPTSEAEVLKVDKFLDASYIGDDGTALREASLGRKLGYNFFMEQTIPATSPSLSTLVTGAVNMGSGAAVGATSLTVDGLSAAITNGTWFTVAGDMIPHQITGTTGGSTPTALAFTPALKYAVADDAVIKLYAPGAVNLVAGYTAGHVAAITVDGFSLAPQIGQFLTFGTTTTVYMVTSASTTSITLDRPLAANVANDATVNLLPAGSYNLALHRNALALVSRPLALPIPGTGAFASVVNYNGLSIRVVMSYDGKAQGHLVTVDMLYGTAVLDSDLGAVLFG